MTICASPNVCGLRPNVLEQVWVWAKQDNERLKSGYSRTVSDSQRTSSLAGQVSLALLVFLLLVLFWLPIKNSFEPLGLVAGLVVHGNLSPLMLNDNSRH